MIMAEMKNCGVSMNVLEYGNSSHYDRCDGPKAGVASMGYGLYAQAKTKNPEGANAIRDLMREYAPIMFNEEENLCRKVVLGSNTASSPGSPPSKVEDCRCRVVLQWKSKADFAAHSSLPYMVPFKMKQGAHMATGKPADDMIVSHGPCWHLEKPGFSGV